MSFNLFYGARLLSHGFRPLNLFSDNMLLEAEEVPPQADQNLAQRFPDTRSLIRLRRKT